MSSTVFERYDIRGKYPDEIDEEFAIKLGRSYAVFLKEENETRVVVGTDTKEDSQLIKQNFIQGLTESGIEVMDAGKGPTDYTAFTAMMKGCFSVQITASHLPQDYTGFKFMYPEGNSLVNKDLDRIRAIYREGSERSGKGNVTGIEDESRKLYVERARDFLKSKDLKPEKSIYIESLGGAGALLLPEILDSFGVKYTVSEESRNPPNPEKHEYKELERAVREGSYDLGVAMDMDADRAKIFTENGWIDGDTLFAILAYALDPEEVVGSIDTSSAVRESFDGVFRETRVGDPFVLDQMVKDDADFGGEPNFHYAFREFVPYHSGTMAALVTSSIDLDNIKDQINDLVTLKESINVKDKKKAINKLKEILVSENKVISQKDGIKYRTGDASVLIRSSGTSEKLRITVHAEDDRKAQKAMEEAKNLIQ